MTKYIQRHSRQTRITHGVFISSCILLAITGLFVFVPPLTQALPASVVYGIRMAHRVLAAIFILFPIVSAIIAPKGAGHFFGKYLRKWDKDDITWLIRFVPYMLGPKRVHMPDQRIVKSGQIVADGMLILISLVMIISGFGLMFGGTGLKSVSLLFHDIGFVALILFGIAHIYLGAGIFQPYRHTVRLMFGDGKVSESDALYHWGHWAREELSSGANVVEKPE
ncbi:MAG: cytochrome b/b6 domain-containing protein [Coriobacteriales bacterium]|jgi:formate dehydrogenase subunit gamma|nr:cytochrome b/b6 domain-containing protein [Coriobacteriales bacterium]